MDRHDVERQDLIVQDLQEIDKDIECVKTPWKKKVAILLAARH